MKSQDSAMLLMHWTSSCTIKHDTETVRLYFIEAKDALVADGRCLLFLINFLGSSQILVQSPNFYMKEQYF